MCRRRYQQHNVQTQYLTSSSPLQVRPRRRGGCCNSRRRQLQAPVAVEAYGSNVYYPQPPPPLVTQPLTSQCGRRRRKNHGPFGMAALLIGAIGMGAEKIKEKRAERKQKKAVLQWEEEQSYEAARKAALRDAHEVRRDERRKSQIVEEERRSVDAEGEAPPPTYEDAVRGSASRTR